MLNSGLKSEEQFRAVYNQTSREFEKIARDKLAAAFSAKQIVASGDFFKKGFDRVCDNQIITLVIEKLLHNRNKPLEILEVACGSTYAQYSSFGNFFHYGSPWLSRKLKYAFGELLNIKTSDNEPDPLLSESASKILAFFYKTSGLNLYTACEEIISANPWRLPQCFSGLVPANAENLCSLPAEIISACNKMRQDFIKISQDDGELFFRPLTDKLIENEAFGIDFVSGTDYLHLKDKFPNDKFDIIFGRHLNPLPSGNSNIKRKLEVFDLSVKSVMSENGTALLHFHDDKNGNNYIHRVY